MLLQIADLLAGKSNCRDYRVWLRHATVRLPPERD